MLAFLGRPMAYLAVLAATGLTVAGWWAANRPDDPVPWEGMIAGVAFSPFQADQSPLNGDRPSLDQVVQDMRHLAPHVGSIRTYSTRDGAELVPEVADTLGLSVTLGAWLSADRTQNALELKALVEMTRRHPSVHRVLVGNEVLLRADLTVDTLLAHIRAVRTAVAVPVSTAEPWHVWLDHPELAKAVDFIAVHLLPYWEGLSVDQAVDYALMRYGQLQATYPDRSIVITEIGWPSAGPWRQGAEASLINQARFIRTFLNAADRLGLDYYLMEAIDQPWKRALEGSAGSAWGLWGPDRSAKFPLAGPVVERPQWPIWCLIAVLLALGPCLAFAGRRTDIKAGGHLFFSLLIHLTLSALIMSAGTAFDGRQSPGATVAWSALILAQTLLMVMVLVDGLDLTEGLWLRQTRRRRDPVRTPLRTDMPKVSIHVPCYNEPPFMVIQTLKALTRLDYPNLEVIVVDNNTKDPAVWRPVEIFCDQYPELIRFHHLDEWPGFKAGALNYALSVTAADADIIAVIDSDYQVDAKWLAATVPLFDRPDVGFVQSPQDYRDWKGNLFKTMIHWEYAGFFHIGMVRRDEYNAIIQHGTMTLIRRRALEQVGGWADWCITEDAELGLRLFKAGYEAHYLNHSFGRGLVPDSFAGYKSQRFRWAYGAVQMLKRHWRDFLPGARRLNAGQKYQFLAGWMVWFADAAHLLFATAAIAWSLGMLAFPSAIEFPPHVFLLPAVFAFLFKVSAGLWLYGYRVPCSLRERLGAAAAGMALTHTVGRAMLAGLFTSKRPFVRTPKCEDHPKLVQGLAMAWEETVLLACLWATALGTAVAFGTDNRNALLWSWLLVVQSLPHLSALVTSMINALPESQDQRRRSITIAEAAD